MYLRTHPSISTIYVYIDAPCNCRIIYDHIVVINDASRLDQRLASVQKHHLLPTLNIVGKDVMHIG